MEARRQQILFLDFLQNRNVVVIHDGDEYQWFVQALCRYNMLELLPGKTLESYPTIVSRFKRDNLVASPGVRYPGWDGRTLYAECQIGKESIGIYPYTRKTVVEWYGEEPYAVEDVLDPGPGAVGGMR